jgi:hypothetical protein
MSAVDGDVNVDGHLDLLESSYAGEIDALFACAGATGKCDDIAEDLEMFRAIDSLRWGQAMIDFDDDGIPEIFEARGALYVDADFTTTDPLPVGLNDLEAPPLFWSRKTTRAPLQVQPSVRGLAEKTGGRGVVTTDLDGDGAMDVVVGTAVGRPLLLRNVRRARGHALNLTLRGKGKNTAAIGARVTLTAAGRTATAMTHAGSSYHSTSDGVLHFGLGAATVVDRIEVRWPTGKRSELTSVPADTPLTITEP